MSAENQPKQTDNQSPEAELDFSQNWHDLDPEARQTIFDNWQEYGDEPKPAGGRLGKFLLKHMTNSPEETMENNYESSSRNNDSQGYELVDEQKPETVRDWSELSDPMTALRFRRGMEFAYTQEPLNERHTKTRRLLETYGVTSASHVKSYEVAVATFFGITEEQWHEQLASEAEHIPAEQLNDFEQNIMLPESILVDHARRIHSREEVKELEPVRIFSEADKYMTLPIDEFDVELRQSADHEKLTLIQHYLLPRVDQQVDVLKNSSPGSKRAEKAQDTLDEIEELLGQFGIERVPTLGTGFSSQFHNTVKTTGSGPYWMVSEEVRPGYHAGSKQVIRKAGVNVARLRLEDLPDEEQEKIRRQKAAKRAGRATTRGAKPTRDTDENSAQGTLF